MPRRRALARTAALFLLASLVSILAACRGEAANVGTGGVSITVSPTPLATGPAEVSVQLTDADGSALKGARVSVEGNMSHAGMAPVLAEARELADGKYVTHDFRFTMGGDWFIIVRVEPKGGQPFERVFDLKGVSGGKMHGGADEGGKK